MSRYLIVSYDSDQQQWFYDVVFAKDRETAKAKLLAVRTYCMDAASLNDADLEGLRTMFEESSVEQSESDLADLRKELEAQGYEAEEIES